MCTITVSETKTASSSSSSSTRASLASSDGVPDLVALIQNAGVQMTAEQRERVLAAYQQQQQLQPQPQPPPPQEQQEEAAVDEAPPAKRQKTQEHNTHNVGKLSLKAFMVAEYKKMASQPRLQGFGGGATCS